MLGGIGRNARAAGLGGDAPGLLTLRMHRMHGLALGDALAKLASGSRFAGMGRGFAGPADLIASESLRVAMAALDAETQSNERALAVSSVADGALGEVSGLLTEVKGLVVANADGTLSDEQKQANQIQIESILASVDRLAGSTSFMGYKLLDGGGQVSSSGEKVAIESMHTSDLGAVEIDGTDYALKDLKSGGALTGDGDKAGKVIDAAINAAATNRGRVGAFAKNHVQSRLNNLGVAHEDLAKANSMIADVDYAAEVSRKFREQVLLHATTFGLRAVDRARRHYIMDLLK
jgi:flagellin-like hook-associated protein FlgL